MAKFKSKVKGKLVVPTEVEGIFVRDMTLGELKEVQDKIAVATKDTKEDSELSEEAFVSPLLVLFQEVIRAEDGEVFEDMQTADDLEANLTFTLMVDIMNAVSKALNGGTDLKK